MHKYIIFLIRATAHNCLCQQSNKKMRKFEKKDRKLTPSKTSLNKGCLLAAGLGEPRYWQQHLKAAN